MKRWFIRHFITPYLARDLDKRLAVKRAERKPRRPVRVIARG